MMIENVKIYVILRNLFVLYLYIIVFDFIFYGSERFVCYDSKNNVIFKVEKVYIIF